jgi:hypothetical protein
MNELTVEKDTPPDTRARPAARRWRWIGVGAFLLLVVVLFDAYLHLSKTYPENSDEANILLMASDMLHGNLILHNWYVSDVPFITTELPEIALLVKLFGLRLDTAHIAAAVTYTLVVAVAMVLAKGRAHGWKAVARMGLALAILLAPQPGVGIFVIIFSVGHIGSSLPVMLTWLVIDRAGRRWWVPPVVAVMLAWAETADPLVLVIAIFPLLAVVIARLLTALAAAIRPNDPGASRLRAFWRAGWFEIALAAAAGAGYLIAWWAGRMISAAGGYTQSPVPYQFDSPGKWYMQARIVVHGLLEMFGAYFVPGQQAPQTGMPAPGGLDQAIAYTRLVVVVLAIWGACAIARRFFRKDADFVSQLLLAAIIANIFAYIPTTLADHTALNTREIAPVLPFAAVLAGRMLGERLLRAPLAGPLVRLRAGGREAGVRVLTAFLVVLMGWYGFALWRQADTPAAPEPYAQLVSFLESRHLSYGVGGYWQASVITVESGGKVTIRAVQPACIQPYQWESKTDWYDASRHTANFLVLSNAPGYFSQFGVSAGTLNLLRVWYKGEDYNVGRVVRVNNGNPIYDYQVRTYSGANLLALGPRLKNSLENPAPWLLRALNQGSYPGSPAALRAVRAQAQADGSGCASS